METEGLNPSISYEAAKRYLQRLRREGQATFDPAQGLWRKTSPAQALPRTLPLSPASVQTPPPSKPGVLWFRLLGFPVCLAAIGALAAINATFVWDFAETEALRWALVAGFLASDLMRPLLIAASFSHLRNAGIFPGIFRFSLGIFVALSLAPLSLLSSVSVLSASFQAGEEQREAAAQAAILLEQLNEQYDLEISRASALWTAYGEECDRGGCGAIARGLEAEARAMHAKASDTLAQLTPLRSEISPDTLAARTSKSLESAGLSIQAQRFLIPLLMALTLELAALFGPALLLARRSGV